MGTMESKRRIGMGMGATIAIALVGLSITAAAPRSAAPGKDRSDIEVIRLDVTPAKIEPRDTDPPGPSLGDQVIFTNDFRQNGTEVGYDGGVCTVVRLDPEPIINCNVSMSLPGGLITAQTMRPAEPSPDPFVAAVNGGTGKYRDARGQIDIDPSDPAVHRFTVSLEKQG